MALLTQKNMGANTVNSAVANLVEKNISITDPFVPYQSKGLATSGLPHIIFWGQAVDTVAPGATSLTARFEAAAKTEGGTPDYFEIVSIAIPTDNTPMIYSFEFPCIFIRVTFFAGAGTSVNLQYTLGAYGP